MKVLAGLTLIFPLIGAAVVGIFGRWIKEKSPFITVPLVGFSFITSFTLFLLTLHSPPLEYSYFTWIPVKDLKVSFGILLDHLSLIMAVTVSFVSFFVHLYSIEYMRGDPSYPRYFSYLSLFVFSMLLLVMSSSLLLMFIGWEAVGLCSYLLIGFWYEKDAPAKAGKKAFIVNRIGDAGFLLGIFTLFYLTGTLNYGEMFVKLNNLPHRIIELSAILLFIGATGKSAQFPLYVWLPDAMEGPTPVSALIHAATMVTAGVYMVARMSPLYHLASSASLLVASVGAFTAIFSASIALLHDDIKRVLAYSTISQLGYMFMAVGVGAYAVGIFHLFTHAFFKALLFLCAGSVMHATHELNMWKMGGLGKKMPWTTTTMIIGSLALSGIFPFAGYFSKDAILRSAFLTGHPTIYYIGVITAFMTAFYMFRLVFNVFFTKPREAKIYEHAHEPGPVMLIPLFVLAIFSIGAGFLGLGEENSPFFKYLEIISPDFSHGGEMASIFTYLPLALGLLGIILAYAVYIRRKPNPDRLRELGGAIYRLIKGKYYVDELYNAIVVGTVRKLADISFRLVDRILIDGTIDGIAGISESAGASLRRRASGYVRSYATYMVLGASLILWLFLLR